jgi:hypothetical protein
MTDQSLLRSLARAFINRLIDSINQRIIASQLLIYRFTFKEAKEMVEKVYSQPGNSENQDRLINYPVLTINTTSNPIAVMAQAIQTMCNKISKWDRTSRLVYYQQSSNFPPSSQASYSAYPHSQLPQSRSNIICYNCM